MSTANRIDHRQIQAWENSKKNTKIHVPTCDARSVANGNARLAKALAEGKSPSGSTVCAGKEVGSVIGKSGPTVLNGIDLGQYAPDEFNNMGVSNLLVKKLEPLMAQYDGRTKRYRTLTGTDALEAVKAFDNNSVTQQDWHELDRAFQAAKTKKIANAFTKRTGKDFFELGQYEQTVVFSLLYQHGESLAAHEKNNPWILNFMDKVAEGKRDEAITILEERAKSGMYTSRRTSEADYMRQQVPSLSIPPLH